MTTPQRLAFAVLCGLLPLCGAAATAAAPVSVDFAWRADHRVQLTYRVPAGVQALQRWQTDEAAHQVWSQQIETDGGCARVTDTEILFPEGCRTASFRITPASLNRDATYEAAQPVADQGVLMHMSFYAATAPGHGLRWTWTPPAGGLVVHEGRVSQRRKTATVTAAEVARALAAPDSRDATEWLRTKRHVYLGRAALRPLPGGVLLRDPTLDAPREQAMVDMLRTSLGRLRQAYGRAPAGPVAVIPVTEDRPGFHGDTDGQRMMRLQVDRDAQRFGPLLPLQHFVAHEVAHWWNAGVFHSDPDRAWLHEGHAEWAALLLTREAGLRQPQDVADELTQAFAQCLALRDDTPAVAIPKGRGRGREAYVCGLTLWALGQWQHGPRPGQAALEGLAEAHLAAARRGGLLREADVARWADGAETGPMHRLLLDPQTGFRSGLTARLEAAAQPWQPEQSSQVGRGQRMSVAQGLMSRLMKADCDGAQGFWVLNDAWRIDEVPGCRHFQGGREWVRLEGWLAIDQALEAARAATERCANASTSATPTLRLTDRQGEDLQLPCPATPLALPTLTLWRLRPDTLQRLSLAP